MDRKPWELPQESLKNKAQCYRLLGHALKIGFMEKEACEDCGDENTEAHHPDYTKPLEVVWLCSLHHHKRHYPNGPQVRSLG